MLSPAMSSQMMSVYAGSKGGGGGGVGGSHPIMQHLQSGHLACVIPLSVRISTGIEQCGGYKGLNSPVFQLAGQIFNHGANWGLANVLQELQGLLSGDPEDWASDLQDAMAALADASVDGNFRSSMASMMNLEMQSLPNALPDQFDSRSTVV